MVANPDGLLPGTYAGSITITAPDATDSPLAVTVELAIAAPRPKVTAVRNGASFMEGPFAGGSIVSIFDTGLGPAEGAPMRITPDKKLATLLAGVRVLIDGTPAPLLFATQNQVNAIVPFGITTGAGAELRVEVDGGASEPVRIGVAGAAPALFTANASGQGQGAILNQDGSINSSTNPAPTGSVIVLYGSGGGSIEPQLADGVIAGADLSRLTLPVTAVVDRNEASVVYAGTAPGMVAGVIQINVRLPGDLRSGQVPVVVRVGGIGSQPGVTLAVR